MTSPIGSSSVGHSSPLTTFDPNRNKNSGSAGYAGNNSAQPETVHPGTPVGPLGHNINTTA
ncbi:conserved hypothetical protein [Paraburkholderia tropica]|uniref:hypothetical protein n=1 Tax=Paraburkholderia TaxID=1822464 RepID=UPI001CAD6235|nr:MULTISPECIES: hypothetical protein [Paraburkholderia]CAG9207011.1 conserved hypothetical protein [Paraburkholderia tropica]